MIIQNISKKKKSWFYFCWLSNLLSNLSLKHVIRLSCKVWRLISGSLLFVLSLVNVVSVKKTVVLYTLCWKFLHLLQYVWVLDVIRQRVDERIMIFVRNLHLWIWLLIGAVLSSALRQFILHKSVKITPIQIHLFFLSLPLVSLNFSGSPGVLLIVSVLFLKEGLFGLLKALSLLDLFRQLLLIGVLFLQFSHFSFVLVILWFLHFLLDALLDMRLLELVSKFVRWHICLWVVFVGLHQHLIVLRE